MQIDLRTASTAVTALEQAGKFADEAAAVKVGRVFGRGRTADVAQLLDAAAAKSSSAADTIRGAQLLPQAGRIDAAAATFRDGAEAARNGQRTAAHGEAMTAAGADLMKLRRQVADGAVGPHDRASAPTWAADLAAGVAHGASAADAAEQVEALRKLRPGIALALVARNEPALTMLSGSELELRIARLATDSLDVVSARTALSSAIDATGDVAQADRMRVNALLLRNDLGIEPAVLEAARASLAQTGNEAAASVALPRVRRSLTFLDPTVAATRVRELATSNASDAGLDLDDLRDLDVLLAMPADTRPVLPVVDRGSLESALASGDVAAANTLVRTPLADIAAWAGVGSASDAGRVLAEHARSASTPDDPAFVRTLVGALDLPTHLRPELPDVRESVYSDIQAIAAGGQRPGPQSEAWGVIDAAWARASIDDAPAAQAQADALLRDVAPRKLEPASLHELQGLASLPDTLRPPSLTARTDYAEVAELRRAGTEVNETWGGWNELDIAHAAARFPTPESADAAAYVVLTKTAPDARSADDWRRLAVTARRTAGLDGHGVGVEAKVLDEVAGLVESHGAINDDWAGWVRLDAAAGRARFTTPEQATAGLDELLVKPTASWTSGDWHRMQEIASLPNTVRPADIQQRDGFAQIARRITDGKQVDATSSGWKDVTALQGARRYPDVESATTAWQDILQHDASSLDADDFDTLAAAVTRFRSARAAGDMTAPDVGVGADQLIEIAGLLRADTSVNAAWGGWAKLDAAAGALRFPDRTSADAAFNGLLASPVGEWTETDWHRMQQLSSLPDAVRPAGLPSRTDFATVARLVHDGSPVNAKWEGWGQIVELVAERRFPNLQSADDAWNSIVARPPSSYTADDFDDLAGAAVWFARDRADGGAARDPGVNVQQLAEVAKLLRSGKEINSAWAGWSTLAAAGAAERFPTREAATARLLELLDQGTARQLPAEAYDELHAISSLPDDLRPDGMPANVNFAQAARIRLSGEAPSGGWKPFFDLDAIQLAHGIGDYRPSAIAHTWLQEHPASAIPAAVDDTSGAAGQLDDATHELELIDDISNVDESYRGNRSPKVDFSSAATLSANAVARLQVAQPQLDAVAGAELASSVQDTIDRLTTQSANLRQAADLAGAGTAVRTLESRHLYPNGGELGRIRADLGAYRSALDAPAGIVVPDAI